MTDAAPDRGRLTYLMVDGENIDVTLGSAILDGRPEPEQRPRWDRVHAFAEQEWGQPVRPLFFLNVPHDPPMTFVQALMRIGFRPVMLTGPEGCKVVDEAIIRTLQALVEVDGDVMLASHDGDFIDHLVPLLEDDDRRVGVIGFREFFNSGLTRLQDEGLEIFDLEYQVEAFTFELPRIRVIPIEEYDPRDFL